jgi:leader peptidase (prepilin peptidase) / N-methyltransferase
MSDPQPWLLFLLAVLGLCVGSFVNVVVWRAPRGMSVNRPPSHCPHCETRLRPIDNVPVVSWLALRARCAHCGEPISARYPLVEAACGALFVAAGLRFGPSFVVAPYAVAFAGLLALSLIDVDTRRLPNRVLYPTGVAAGALFVAAAALEGEWGALGRAGIGAVAGFAALLVVHLAVPHGMGFGDVRLAGLLGGLLGWLGLAYVPFGLLAGFFLGAVYGVALLAAGRATRRSKVPFGPFLAAGAVALILVGGPFVDWYLGLLGRA